MSSAVGPAGHSRNDAAGGVARGLLAKILRTGRVAETAPPPPEPLPLPLQATRGSLQLRHVDAGSCNGCEIELSGCFSPVYDAERYGARLVASPRHADGLVVTGVVTRNMAHAVRNTFEAIAEPAVVIAVGDCACDGGVFGAAYGVVGPVSSVLPVDARVAGCPPSPPEIIAVLRAVTGR
jgi:formate hydrogenlyase subunit 7